MLDDTLWNVRYENFWTVVSLFIFFCVSFIQFFMFNLTRVGLGYTLWNVTYENFWIVTPSFILKKPFTNSAKRPQKHVRTLNSRRWNPKKYLPHTHIDLKIARLRFRNVAALRRSYRAPKLAPTAISWGGPAPRRLPRRRVPLGRRGIRDGLPQGRRAYPIRTPPSLIYFDRTSPCFYFVPLPGVHVKCEPDVKRTGWDGFARLPLYLNGFEWPLGRSNWKWNGLNWSKCPVGTYSSLPSSSSSWLELHVLWDISVSHMTSVFPLLGLFHISPSRFSSFDYNHRYFPYRYH